VRTSGAWFAHTIELALLGFALVHVDAVAATRVHPAIYGGMSMCKYAYEARRLYDPDVVDRAFKIGPSAGVMLVYPSLTSLGVETGLAYDRKGGAVTLPTNYDQEPRYDINFALSYLSIPVAVRVPVRRGAKTSLYAKAIGELSFLLSAGYGDVDLKDSTRRIDLGVGGGLGCGCELGGRTLFLETTYVHGLLDVAEPSAPVFDVRASNREFRFAAGVFL